MTKTLAIVACDHGFGHVRRCCLIALDLYNSGYSVTIFAPDSYLDRLRSYIPSLALIHFIHFETKTTLSSLSLSLSSCIEWLDRLPSLDNFDFVISDNLPEILAIRNDAILSAQFFWHDVSPRICPDYSDLCSDLLARFSPLVFGCELFAMPAVRSQLGFIPVGLYKNPLLVEAITKIVSLSRTDLLVTGGTTPSARNQLTNYIRILLKNGPSDFKRVHVDPNLLPHDPPPWMIKADFSVDMFCSLKCAVCRPGLGILTDLLTVGVKIIPLFEPDNAEMVFNAKVVKHLASH